LPTRSGKLPPERVAVGMNPEATADQRSFGRRRGRRLSTRQQALLDEVLPRLRLELSDPCPPDPGRLFPQRVDALWLEIGFGGAEHLLWQARHNPQIGLIGCEVFEDGIVKALAGIEEQALANIRLGDQDARETLRWLPPGSLDRIFILFPDPWPKKRHRKRRLVSRNLLDLLVRVMAPGAELRVATDIADYARWILLATQAHPALSWQVEGPRDWRQRPADWPQTRYETKALAQGRRCYFLRYFKPVAR
jgi:tRNA (guanine-N7-)-methyltransferase